MDNSNILKKQSILIAMGFMFVFDGIFFSLLNLDFFKFGLRELWPVIVLNSSLAFFATDFFIFKRLRTVFFFPSIMLLILGVFFLLFSARIVPITFRKFIGFAWPIILTVFGILLIVVYGVQQMNKKEFPYMEDDSEITEVV